MFYLNPYPGSSPKKETYSWCHLCCGIGYHHWNHSLAGQLEFLGKLSLYVWSLHVSFQFLFSPLFHIKSRKQLPYLVFSFLKKVFKGTLCFIFQNAKRKRLMYFGGGIIAFLIFTLFLIWVASWIKTQNTFFKKEITLISIYEVEVPLIQQCICFQPSNF